MPFLGQAKIVIDQATLPAGVAGVPRDDGVLGQVVTLRNADNTNISGTTGGWLWVLFKPLGSAATLSSPTSPTCSFTPDVDGTYRVELYVNEKQKPNQKARSAIAVRDGAGFRYPAQGESNENTWTSAYTLNPNETGWWEDIDKILRSGQAAIDGTHVTATAQPGLPNSRRLQVGAGLSLVDGGPGGDITINTAFTAGTKRLADVALQAENILSTRAVKASTRDNTKYGQVNLGSESVGGKGVKADYATIGGGIDNLCSGSYATVSGGSGNTVSGLGSVICGGESNTVSGLRGAIVGGISNTVSADRSFIGAGVSNQVTAVRGAIVAGESNTVSAQRGFIGAGSTNTVGNDNAVVVGGVSNSCSGVRGFIGAGQSNSLGAVQDSVIGGGGNNSTADDYTVVGGGSTNTATAIYAACLGGHKCTAGGIASACGGGSANTASGDYSVAPGGSANTASGSYSSVLAGRSSTASASDAHALGYGAQAIHAGAVVIKDGAATTQASTAANELTLRFDGNVRVISSGGKFVRRLGTSTNNYSEQVQSQQTTTDGTAQTVNIASVPSGADCTVRGTLKGKQNGSANGRSLAFWATYTNNGGAVAIVGSAHVNDLKGAPAWSLAVGISGTHIQLQFTGAAATTIRWTWDFEVHYGGQT